jgi:hypothetical protein
MRRLTLGLLAALLSTSCGGAALSGPVAVTKAPAPIPPVAVTTLAFDVVACSNQPRVGQALASQ